MARTEFFKHFFSFVRFQSHIDRHTAELYNNNKKKHSIIATEILLEICWGTFSNNDKKKNHSNFHIEYASRVYREKENVKLLLFKRFNGSCAMSNWSYLYTYYMCVCALVCSILPSLSSSVYLLMHGSINNIILNLWCFYARNNYSSSAFMASRVLWSL